MVYLLENPPAYVLLFNLFDAVVHYRHKAPQTNLVYWVCLEKQPS